MTYYCGLKWNYQLYHYNSKSSIPVTGFPLASVTATDWTVSVTGLPLAS